MVEVAGSMLRFTPEDQDSIPDTGTSGSISLNRRDDGIGDSDASDIQIMVER